MSNRLLSKAALSAAILSIGIYSTAHAHNGSATLNPLGGNPSATDLAHITCYDDGNGNPAKLRVQIKDQSEPVDGLLLSVQIYKGLKAISITDPVSGDADYSQAIELDAGLGVYSVMVDKTAAGPRRFNLVWHCLTAENIHTGTDIVVRQIQ
ncbi:MAG TPA: hypothetical protein EYQ43_02300 [Methyloprofundus sp.]|uniref:hypothetical protein n=1 Tax=Methyloprofundus sp. TaxID=2020875 RepID=UPI0017C141F8|nr:hypothetical protein [Methyloprofundus sp.]HIG64403.1 hypothetical protein [Methyloprofundus sp.]HIL78627.1 hypothetical protein [Methylococcales bacterium]